MKGIKADGTAIQVMSVDDSAISRKMIKKALEPEGFVVCAEAGNGKDAVELYPKIKADVITMDVTMPVMDGLDAASAIKKINPKQKIIMLSAMGDNDIINDAKSRGIDDVYCKPFKAPELVERILKLM